MASAVSSTPEDEGATPGMLRWCFVLYVVVVVVVEVEVAVEDPVAVGGCGCC